MYTKEMLESIKKVEATRDARLKEILAGNHPRRMTAEEKDQVLLENHPDHIKSQFAELIIGPNKGEKVPLELAETLQASPRVKPEDIDLTKIDYDVDVLQIIDDDNKVINLKNTKIGLAKTNFYGKFDCLLSPELFV